MSPFVFRVRRTTWCFPRVGCKCHVRGDCNKELRNSYLACLCSYQHFATHRKVCFHTALALRSSRSHVAVLNDLTATYFGPLLLRRSLVHHVGDDFRFMVRIFLFLLCLNWDVFQLTVSFCSGTSSLQIPYEITYWHYPAVLPRCLLGSSLLESTPSLTCMSGHNFCGCVKLTLILPRLRP